MNCPFICTIDDELYSAVSSSEEEFEHATQERQQPVIINERDSDEVAGKLVQVMVMFVCLWQSVFKISDTALEIFLKFLSSLVKVLSGSTSSVITSLASMLPSSIYLLRKQSKHENCEKFIEYVVCPSCFCLYKMENCLTVESGEQVPKLCSYIKYPNHPLLAYRKPCDTPLLKKIRLFNGKVEYRPRYAYAYQPLKASLQLLLNRPGFADKLEWWRNRNSLDNKLSDVYDGNIWKEFLSEKHNYFLKFKKNYGVMLNLDFFQPYKHTTESYGAVYLTLMNLPRSERFKQENVILVSIIPPFPHEPPTLNTFLRPLIDELKEFWNGIRLSTAESCSYKPLIKLALMCVACDIPAARKCCGFKGHSANYGCSKCMKFFPGSVGSKNFSGFDRSKWLPRTYEEHMRVIEEIKKCKTQTAIESLETAKGVKFSILTELPYFDPIRFTVIDPMHNLFLGTAKTMMKNIWLKRDIITHEQLNIIQSRIDNLKVPSDLGRIPKKISSNFSGFTAEQLKNWVLLYSMYALRGILSQDEYHCWQAFVLACFLICRRTICMQDAIKADLLFVKFGTHVQRIYGENVITPNMHLHCHIIDCLKDYGSMYGFWCFSYERYNGILGSFPTNKKNVASQLMRRFLYESQCRSYCLPKDLPEEFAHVLPALFSSDPSEIHRHVTPVLLSNCHDFSQIQLPSLFKMSILTPDDFINIKTVYKCLYDDTEEYTFTRTIKIIKSMKIYDQQFGSMRDARMTNSSFLMASWAKEDGTFYVDNEPNRLIRPGKVLHYILNKVQIGNDTYREHAFAVVGWLTEHRCRYLYGKPMEIWNHSKYIQDGPATFLPVHKITCRFVAGFGKISKPGGGEETVMFVNPIPNLQFF